MVKLLGDIRGADREQTDQVLSAVERLSGVADFQTAYAGVRDILRYLCDLVDRQTRTRQQALVEEMKEFIASHMSDLALNRYMVASEFGLNETYFSGFFREHSGETFSDFLEKTRIQRALRLLAETTRTFTDIARELGYSSDKVFRRAFKRVTGSSPRAYRERQAAQRRR